MHRFFRDCHQNLLFEGEFVGLLFAFFNSLNVGRDQIVKGVDPLIDLAKGIVVDDRELT